MLSLCFPAVGEETLEGALEPYVSVTAPLLCVGDALPSGWTPFAPEPLNDCTPACHLLRW